MFVNLSSLSSFYRRWGRGDFRCRHTKKRRPAIFRYRPTTASNHLWRSLRIERSSNNDLVLLVKSPDRGGSSYRKLSIKKAVFVRIRRQRYSKYLKRQSFWRKKLWGEMFFVAQMRMVYFFLSRAETQRAQSLRRVFLWSKDFRI